MNIPLDRDKPTALPRQIQAHLERLIHERLLTPGMKLPATRELARQLGVNRGTVALAYEELVATGWARAHVGQGTFVAERAGERRRRRSRRPPRPRSRSTGPASSRAARRSSAPTTSARVR